MLFTDRLTLSANSATGHVRRHFTASSFTLLQQVRIGLQSVILCDFSMAFVNGFIRDLSNAIVYRACLGCGSVSFQLSFLSYFTCF